MRRCSGLAQAPLPRHRSPRHGTIADSWDGCGSLSNTAAASLRRSAVCADAPTAGCRWRSGAEESPRRERRHMVAVTRIGPRPCGARVRHGSARERNARHGRGDLAWQVPDLRPPTQMFGTVKMNAWIKRHRLHPTRRAEWLHVQRALDRPVGRLGWIARHRGDWACWSLGQLRASWWVGGSAAAVGKLAGPRQLFP